MFKKIVSFVQPNFRVGPVSANAWYLPYSIGCLWAYANQFESVQQQFEIGEIVFRRDSIEPTAQKLASHAAVAFRDRKSTRLNSSHSQQSRMPSSA